MRWLWRIIGLFIGFKIAGFNGAFLGFLAGYLFDTRDTLRGFFKVSGNAAVQTQFFTSLFRLMGYLAKVDGRVSQAEVDFAQDLMVRLQLTAEHKRQAIALFKEGSTPEFAWQVELDAFVKVCESKQILLTYLVASVCSDEQGDPRELAALESMSAYLGFHPEFLRQLLRMSRAQDFFGAGYRSDNSHNYSRRESSQQGSSQQQSRDYQKSNKTEQRDPLSMAYLALGASPAESLAQIKLRYRKLMSQYHPDKLTGQGVPEDMVKMGTQKAQEVQAAFDLISAHLKNKS